LFLEVVKGEADDGMLRKALGWARTGIATPSLLRFAPGKSGDSTDAARGC